MREIGDYLRQVRETKQMSLQDIQDITKIRMQYLEALESGNFGIIPGEVYLKGFLSNYATAVGIDPQLVLDQYRQAKASQERQLTLEPVNSPNTGWKKSSPPGIAARVEEIVNADWFKGVYLGLAIALLAVLLFSVLILPALQVKPPEETEPTNESETTANQVLPLPAPITVDAEFTDNVWVQVIADGQKLFGEEGFVFSAASSRQEWTAQQLMEIQLGNSGGIRLHFNGKNLGNIGESGTTKVIRLTPNGLAP